ncbi:MAG: hypothetical protein ACT4N2_08620 [Hyphomicrobium sp.]
MNVKAKRALGVLAGLILGLGAGVRFAVAADEAPPKPLVCSFPSGSSHTYEKGSFQTQTPAPLSFEIADIDLDKQSAALVAADGGKAGKLALARAIGANHFLEIANEGFWTITTVYDRDAATGQHPAVHSRHLGVVGQPLVAQYTGSCREK